MSLFLHHNIFQILADTASIAWSACSSIWFCQRCMLRFFALQGWLTALTGMKFGVEESTKGFTPIIARVRVWAQKLKNLNKFLPNFGIFMPRTGTSFVQFLQNFQWLWIFLLGHVLQFWEIWSRGSSVMGVYIWGCLVTPKFSAPLVHQTAEHFGLQGRAWDPLSRAKFGGARTACCQGAKMLSFCLSDWQTKTQHWPLGQKMSFFAP